MKYACNNRPDYELTMMVQYGYTKTDGSSRVDKMVEIPFTMSQDCQFTKTELGKTDPKCNNCERKEK
jgi:hypothetical protein